MTDIYEGTATEGINPDTQYIDECSTEEMLRLINNEDARVAGAVRRELPRIARAVDAITASLQNGGRLIYVGAGTSGRLGVLDASECPPTFGTDPEMVQGYIAGGDVALRTAVEGVEDSETLGTQQIIDARVNRKDVVTGITASGSAPFVCGAVKKAHEIGAVTIGIVNNDNSVLEGLVDICIASVVGPEVVMGSTRMKAGTADKMVLNMLTTAVMIRLGKTYGNLMVDLHATNKKLDRRAIRMVKLATGCDDEEAKAAIAQTNGSVKLAIMCILSGKDASDARALLDASGGHLKEALNMCQG